MHIILSILSVIGIALLVIIGLVLLILLLVLLVPFRYKLHAAKMEDLEAGASVTWLLHFVKVSVTYIQKKIDFDIRILGFSIKKLIFKEKKPAKPKETEKKEKAVKEKPAKPKKVKKKKQPKKIMPEQSTPKRVVKEAKSAALAEARAKSEDALPPETIFEKDEKPAGLIEKLKEKTKKLREMLHTGKLWGDAFLAIKGYLFKIIKHIVPKKLKGKVKLGLEDPATTGQILAAYCALYPVTPKDLEFTPVFEEPVMECDIDIKGRVCLIVLAVYGLKIFFNKKVKTAMGR